MHYRSSIFSLKSLLSGFFLMFFIWGAYAQKPPLDHDVYDQWQSIGQKAFSDNGKWVLYQINPQEGDKTLFIQSTDNKVFLEVPRGEKAQFTGGSDFSIFKIRPTYEDLKLVRIKKKKEADIAKDTLGIYNLKASELLKIPNVKSFKIPEKKGSYVAYLVDKEKDTTQSKKTTKPSKKMEPLPLVLKSLSTGREEQIDHVTDYFFDGNGNYLVYVRKNPNAKDAKSENETDEAAADEQTTDSVNSAEEKEEIAGPFGVFLVELKTMRKHLLFEGEGMYSQFVFDENGKQLSFIATEDEEKVLVKHFKVYHSVLPRKARELVNDHAEGVPNDWVISENYKPQFSKNGKRLFIGIAPQPIAKDTTLIAEDHAVVDIWHYKEDYIQPQQLVNLEKDLKKSYLAVVDLTQDTKLVPLADETINWAQLVDEGNAPFVFASSNYGRRIERQWDISGVNSYYLVDVTTGKRIEVVADLAGTAKMSPQGDYVLYFDSQQKNWYAYEVKSGSVKALNKGVSVSFADEEFDMPDYPYAYGIQGWTSKDQSVLIRDRYDIWEFDLKGDKAPRMLTQGIGRQSEVTFTILNPDKEKRFFEPGESLFLHAFDNRSKDSGLYTITVKSKKLPRKLRMDAFGGYNSLFKAEEANNYGYVKYSFTDSPNLYISNDLKSETRLTRTNPQQADYNWGTSELVSWTTPQGHKASGVLFKPEDFDESKKYPLIVYFYEKLSDNLNRYEAPAPTPSRLNITYFVSNGYLVFTPDISYTDGHPGKSAEAYINSGVEFLKTHSWVDGAKIGIQGQSWGGYQVAHLITVTDMYAAAWAGAPVANMTSAYGGIRWQSGMSRQFQYEKTQSRIGKPLWDALDLYLENSPLFRMPEVRTPVVIMHNDKDGAVPWYQGIEMFMALRRLGKPAWLLNYNDDEHNLMKRQNRKDIQRRQQQFFDYYLKDAQAPIWMVKGVPAIMKGKDWGFELTNEKVN